MNFSSACRRKEAKLVGLLAVIKTKGLGTAKKKLTVKQSNTKVEPRMRALFFALINKKRISNEQT